MGRPIADAVLKKAEKRLEQQDARERNVVEGKFGAVVSELEAVNAYSPFVINLMGIAPAIPGRWRPHDMTLATHEKSRT